jgi:hypothetical protein
LKISKKKVYKNIVRFTGERKEGNNESQSSWSLAVSSLTNKPTRKSIKKRLHEFGCVRLVRVS